MVADDGTLSDTIDRAYITGPVEDGSLLDEDFAHAPVVGQQAQLAANRQIRRLVHPATAAAKVDSITNRSQTQRVTVVAKDVTQGTAVCNATRHRHQRCASVSGRLHCLPVQSCASCSPGLSGWDWRKCRLLKRRGGEEQRPLRSVRRPTQLCPHWLSRSSAPCAAGVDRLHCRTAARGWGFASPGLLGWCSRGVGK